jgi:hypothetical protein
VAVGRGGVGGGGRRGQSLGWTLIERLGGHLDIVNEPDAIARTVIELTR